MKADPPIIRKAAVVRGFGLRFRDANVDDAEFVLALRLDEIKSRYLSKTSNDLDDQREWLANYADSDDQAYFIIERRGRPIGTVRIYDARESSFRLGSLVLMEGGSRGATMEALGMILFYAVDHLGFDSCYFDVRKANERVWNFYERFGVERSGETEDDYHYFYSREAIRNTIDRYRIFLPSGIVVSRAGAKDTYYGSAPFEQAGLT